MGAWDAGLLENDTSLDGLGALDAQLMEDVVALGAAKPTAVHTAKLAATVGLLATISPFSFSRDSEDAEKVRAALTAHQAGIARLKPKARTFLLGIIDGDGEKLTRPTAKLTAALSTAFYGPSKKPATSPFGPFRKELFDSPAAQATLQRFAKACLAMLAEDFSDEDTWSDLCREATSVGALVALLLLHGAKVPVKKLEGWRKKAQKGLATLEADPDEELDFHREFHGYMDKAFALAIAKYR
jgi:hypothetical protein